MFSTQEWFETLYDTSFEAHQKLVLACVVSDDNIQALLPLMVDGDHWKSFNHRYTSLFSLLLLDETKTDVITCLAEGLSQLSISSLSLSPIAENDNSMLELKQAFESIDYTYYQHFLFYNWIHRPERQTYDEYLAQRPSILRNTIKRKQRKLEREHNYSLHMYTGDEVKQALIDYHDAYSSSWKANEQYASLLDSVAIKFSIPNWTRLAILKIDGKAAAAQLWFVVGGKASIFRLAYNEEWKQYSPGSILTAYLMEYVIDSDKVEEIDFLTGNETYKQDWMSERRQRCSMTFRKPKKAQSKIAQGFESLRTIFNAH